MPKVLHPALVDMHVHLREPGQTYKEDIASGCAAAHAGGFGAVAAMANTVPVIDSPALVRFVLDRARGLPVRVCPVAAVTEGFGGERLTDFAALRQAGAVALSDDGLPIQSEALMKDALMRAHSVGLPLLDHCEPETENAERDLFLARQTGCPVHICHVSRADTVAVLREAKRRGTPFTAETAPHYLVPWASGRMNPPLGDAQDISAVLDALCDGVITVIATDHAPHTAQEKASETPPNGVIGLETAVPVVLEALYHTRRMTLDAILALLCENPARILGIPLPGTTICLDTDRPMAIDPAQFCSRARNTAFAGQTVRGRISHVLP